MRSVPSVVVVLVSIGGEPDVVSDGADFIIFGTINLHCELPNSHGLSLAHFPFGRPTMKMTTVVLWSHRRQRTSNAG